LVLRLTAPSARTFVGEVYKSVIACDAKLTIPLIFL
jgi:hypothetical protein